MVPLETTNDAAGRGRADLREEVALREEGGDTGVSSELSVLRATDDEADGYELTCLI